MDGPGKYLKPLARRYALRGEAVALEHEYDESQEFRVAALPVKGKRTDASRQELEEDKDRLVREAFAVLRDSLGRLRDRDFPARKGFGSVEVLPRDGRYVVFSDHHITPLGHLQDFFTRINADLYGEVLEQYLERGSTVIENGDVEELIIFDPRAEHGHFASLREAVPADWTDDTCKVELRARRRAVRRRQLQAILSDTALQRWLDASAALAAEGRLVRIAGNHDFELQRAELGELFAARTGYTRPFFDMVFLEDGDRVAYAILHGHQFDYVSHPDRGERFGEVYSETGGMWFQGADRVWRWDVDHIDAWVSGRAPLDDDVVTDNAGGDRGDGWLRTWFEEVMDAKNIAWEHFACRTAAGALVFEVWAGKRFVKFRHMDEELICELLQDIPEERRPTLVLGHSHEVRLDPWSPRLGRVVPEYLNTGSAGRFEGLIWAVEIDGDGHRLVSWSRADGQGPAVRRVWEADGEERWLGRDRRVLRPSG